MSLGRGVRNKLLHHPCHDPTPHRKSSFCCSKNSSSPGFIGFMPSTFCATPTTTKLRDGYSYWTPCSVLWRLCPILGITSVLTIIRSKRFIKESRPVGLESQF